MQAPVDKREKKGARQGEKEEERERVNEGERNKERESHWGVVREEGKREREKEGLARFQSSQNTPSPRALEEGTGWDFLSLRFKVEVPQCTGRCEGDQCYPWASACTHTHTHTHSEINQLHNKIVCVRVCL